MPAPNTTPVAPSQFQPWASFFGGNVTAPQAVPSAFGASALGQPPSNGQYTGGWAYPDAWANFYEGKQGFTSPQNQNSPAGALAATNYANNINNPNDPNLLGWEQAYGNPNTILQRDQNWAQSLGSAPTGTPSNELTGGWQNPEAWAAFYGGTQGFTAPQNAGSPASALEAAAQIAKTSNPQDNPALLGWVQDFGQPGSVLANTPNWAASLGAAPINAQGQGSNPTGGWLSPLAWAAYYGGFQGFPNAVDNTLQDARNWAGVTNADDPSLLGWELDYGNPRTVVSTIEASPEYQQYVAQLAAYNAAVAAQQAAQPAPVTHRRRAQASPQPPAGAVPFSDPAAPGVTYLVYSGGYANAWGPGTNFQLQLYVPPGANYGGGVANKYDPQLAAGVLASYNQQQQAQAAAGANYKPPPPVPIPPGFIPISNITGISAIQYVNGYAYVWGPGTYYQPILYAAGANYGANVPHIGNVGGGGGGGGGVGPTIPILNEIIPFTVPQPAYSPVTSGLILGGGSYTGYVSGPGVAPGLSPLSNDQIGTSISQLAGGPGPTAPAIGNTLALGGTSGGSDFMPFGPGTGEGATAAANREFWAALNTGNFSDSTLASAAFGGPPPSYSNVQQAISETPQVPAAPINFDSGFIQMPPDDFTDFTRSDLGGRANQSENPWSVFPDFGGLETTIEQAFRNLGAGWTSPIEPNPSTTFGDILSSPPAQPVDDLGRPIADIPPLSLPDFGGLPPSWTIPPPEEQPGSFLGNIVGGLGNLLTPFTPAERDTSGINPDIAIEDVRGALPPTAGAIFDAPLLQGAMATPEIPGDFSQGFAPDANYSDYNNLPRDVFADPGAGFGASTLYQEGYGQPVLQEPPVYSPDVKLQKASELLDRTRGMTLEQLGKMFHLPPMDPRTPDAIRNFVIDFNDLPRSAAQIWQLAPMGASAVTSEAQIAQDLANSYAKILAQSGTDAASVRAATGAVSWNVTGAPAPTPQYTTTPIYGDSAGIPSYGGPADHPVPPANVGPQGPPRPPADIPQVDFPQLAFESGLHGNTLIDPVMGFPDVAPQAPWPDAPPADIPRPPADIPNTSNYQPISEAWPGSGPAPGWTPEEIAARVAQIGARGDVSDIDIAGQRYNYFQSQGLRPSQVDRTTVDTPYGPITVAQTAADDFQSFLQTLFDEGFPSGQPPGSYADRTKYAGGSGEVTDRTPTNAISSHAYGAAIDINNSTELTPAQIQWIASHPDIFQDALQDNNISWGHGINLRFGPDTPHMEWNGPTAAPQFAEGVGGMFSSADFPTFPPDVSPTINPLAEPTFANYLTLSEQLGDPFQHYSQFELPGFTAPPSLEGRISDLPTFNADWTKFQEQPSTNILDLRQIANVLPASPYDSADYGLALAAGGNMEEQQQGIETGIPIQQVGGAIGPIIPGLLRTARDAYNNYNQSPTFDQVAGTFPESTFAPQQQTMSIPELQGGFNGVPPEAYGYNLPPDVFAADFQGGPLAGRPGSPFSPTADLSVLTHGMYPVSNKVFTGLPEQNLIYAPTNTTNFGDVGAYTDPNNRGAYNLTINPTGQSGYNTNFGGVSLPWSDTYNNIVLVQAPNGEWQYLPIVDKGPSQTGTSHGELDILNASLPGFGYNNRANVPGAGWQFQVINPQGGFGGPPIVNPQGGPYAGQQSFVTGPAVPTLRFIP